MVLLVEWYFNKLVHLVFITYTAASIVYMDDTGEWGAD